MWRSKFNFKTRSIFRKHNCCRKRQVIKFYLSHIINSSKETRFLTKLVKLTWGSCFLIRTIRVNVRGGFRFYLTWWCVGWRAERLFDLLGELIRQNNTACKLSLVKYLILFSYRDLKIFPIFDSSRINQDRRCNKD